MSFWSDFGGAAQAPFTWAYNKASAIDTLANNLLSGAGGAAGGLANLLSGNSNTLIYIGVGIAAIVIVPIVLQKVL